MKRIFCLLFLAILALALLCSCGTHDNTEEPPINEEHTHEFGEWNITRGPTCVADGEKTRSCSCGETEVWSISKISHNYIDGICVNCAAEQPSPEDLFVFTELEDGNYSVKAKDHYTISGKIVIPSEYNGKSVTKIETAGFSWSSKITEVVIPDSIVRIDSTAFVSCSSLVKVTMSKGVSEIPVACFADCDKLEEVILHDGITKICHSAFMNCNFLTEIELFNGIKVIEDWAFKNCFSLETINFPESIETIGQSCFYFTSLEEIRLPNSLKTIGNEAFYGIWTLKKIYFGSGLTQICDDAFDQCRSISDVYYAGSEVQWNEILIRVGNEYLTSADIHFNYLSE